MGTLGRMPGRPAGWPLQNLPRPIRDRRWFRQASQPHPMDLRSGEFEKALCARRIVDIAHSETMRELRTSLFGAPLFVDPDLRYPRRPKGWCEVDNAFVRLMVITRLDRSVCDEDV